MSKSAIDRLGDRLRQGTMTLTDLIELTAYRKLFASAYQMAIDVVRDELGLQPTGRPEKSTSAIVEKLQRETIRLTQIQDIAGLRIVVPATEDQNRTVKDITIAFEQCVVLDRRERPSNGYRAVHVVVFLDQHPVEIQVRTIFQHQWAEVSEKLADILDPSLKYGGGPVEARNYLNDTSHLVATFEELGQRHNALSRMIEEDYGQHDEIERVKIEGGKRFADLESQVRVLLDKILMDLEQIRGST